MTAAPPRNGTHARQSDLSRAWTAVKKKAGVAHPSGREQVVLASVDRLNCYPGQWLLAAGPWRALGIALLLVLRLELVTHIARQARAG